MRSSLCLRIAALLVLLLGPSAIASAQLTTGTVSGTVQDQQQASVPGATVSIVSETRGTALPSVVTGSAGDFTFVNISPDSYKITVTLTGFKNAERSGIVVSPGSRIVVPNIRLEIGGASETIAVTAEAGLVQAQSGERSFEVGTSAVQNLPIQSRSFSSLAALAPGVTLDANGNPTRVGGGGSSNLMLDGVGINDTFSGSPLVQVNVESIAEVKVLTSGYQAEFGRNAGVQVTAVTKSGTNRFHGSVYDVERNSKWNSNSKVNILNGDAKTRIKQRDWGFSAGGPVGKPGGANKLFFFYAQEFEPRTQGGDTFRYRVPTALERAGDFSQTLDNNGALFNLIKDPLSSAACSASNQAGCFADGGVLGRIPKSRLYQPGLNALNIYPMPTLVGSAAAGLGYNYEVVRPVENTISYQPAVRLDYQASPSLRASFKYTGWWQKNNLWAGTIPGFNDGKMWKPVISTYAATLNKTLNASTFLEVSFGKAKDDLSGCSVGQNGTGPVFCTGGLPALTFQQPISMNEVSNRLTAGLGDLPTLFDKNTMFVVDPSYYAYRALTGVAPPFFVDGQVLHTPNFTWTGGRVANAPPNTPYPAFINDNITYDLSASLTHVMGRHTVKGGYFQNYGIKDQAPNNMSTLFGTLNFNNDSTNPLDTAFPFANAAAGVVGSYAQLSRYAEGRFTQWNIEGYIQDNWKVSNKLTLDYGLRLVHQTPTYDTNLLTSTFLPNRYDIAAAPLLYVTGCSTGTTCSGTVRQAKNPATGQLLGPGSAVLIGTAVPNSGDRLDGVFKAGQGVSKTLYNWPAFGVSPRFGAAYDLTGQQKLIVRGGVGVYFDRPAANTVLSQLTNPPTIQNVTVRNVQLQSLGSTSSGFSPLGISSLSVFKENMGLPSSTQWNVGAQIVLPWASALDLSYVGQHAWNQLIGVNINSVDIGSAFLAKNQDPTLSSATPGANALPTDSLRAIRGFGAITQQQDIGWNTYHSIQASYQRRFKNGVSFGFVDTVSLVNEAFIAPRLQHNADGTYTYRADQAQAQSLLQLDPVRHTMKANFVWDLPDLHMSSSAGRIVNQVVNDWQLAGVWTGASAAPYSAAYSIQGVSAVNLSGSADFARRILINGDPGTGCTNDPLRQFNTAAFSAPTVNTTGEGIGLESSPNAIKGCFQSALDLSISRTIRLGGSRTLQLRLDVFNAPNQAIVTARNATLNVASLTTTSTATNLPFDASGAVIATRSQPKNAGFGVATGYQSPRSAQFQVRLAF